MQNQGGKVERDSCFREKSNSFHWWSRWKAKYFTGVISYYHTAVDIRLNDLVKGLLWNTVSLEMTKDIFMTVSEPFKGWKVYLDSKWDNMSLRRMRTVSTMDSVSSSLDISVPPLTFDIVMCHPH